jgi:hypothetical protein
MKHGLDATFGCGGGCFAIRLTAVVQSKCQISGSRFNKVAMEIATDGSNVHGNFTVNGLFYSVNIITATNVQSGRAFQFNQDFVWLRCRKIRRVTSRGEQQTQCR